MFKKKNKVTPVNERSEQYKVKPLRRVHKSDDLQRTYKLAQQLANDQVDQNPPTVEIDCCFCCKIM